MTSPRMITARPFSSTPRPTSGEMELKASPKSTPAAPPSAEERKNAMAMARSTSMPTMRAARGLSATARICRPSRLRASRRVSTAISTTEMPTMQSWRREAVAAPIRTTRSGKVPGGNREMSGPKICSAMASNTVAMASELISPEMFESARPRKGRNATRSRTIPIAPPARTAAGSATQSDRCASATSASAMNAASMNTAWWARFKMSRTPNTSVYPTAKSA